jgi:class 3 adenylate cyclase
MTGTETLPTGTVTFLFTDIEGSTRLAQQFPEQISGLLALHNEILNRAAQASDGYVFQTAGDSFCIAFRSALEALRAAIEAQRMLYQAAWGPATVKVRMGVHTGRADIQERGRYDGYLTLSRVQRLMSAAYGGQVLVSAAAQDLLQESMPEGASLRDLGELRLRDMAQAEHVYQLIIRDLPADFPPIKALESHRHNIPAPVTSLVGRQRHVKKFMRGCWRIAW